MHSTASLSIKTHDFGERLGDAHLESSGKEKSKTLTILVQITSHEALIGSVEEGIKAV
jgi:hypothetical protein